MKMSIYPIAISAICVVLVIGLKNTLKAFLGLPKWLLFDIVASRAKNSIRKK
jgi:hypothetical protein